MNCRRSALAMRLARSSSGSCFIIGRQTAAKAFPTTNPTSTGSTAPGIPPIPIQKVSTSARRGVPRKSPSMTAALWFSNTPDVARRTPKTTAAKIILGKAARKATFAANESCRETSEFRQIPAFYGSFFISKFLFSAFQLYPNPPFPPQPPFPRPPVRPTPVSGASRQKQIPSSDCHGAIGHANGEATPQVAAKTAPPLELDLGDGRRLVLDSPDPFPEEEWAVSGAT